MKMTHRLSKAVLTLHITFSVGWLGAVAVFIVLAITGLTTMDTQVARSTYLAMELSTWFVIIPFCLASFTTGLIQAIGTKWELFKHYWIIVKLFLTFGMTVLLFLHLQPIGYLARVAADASFSNTQHSGQLIDLIAKAGAAILVLLTITTISIYKPWGKIQFAQSNNNQSVNMQDNGNKIKKSWAFYAFIGLVVLIIIFIISHLFGGGMPKH